MLKLRPFTGKTRQIAEIDAHTKIRTVSINGEFVSDILDVPNSQVVLAVFCKLSFLARYPERRSKRFNEWFVVLTDGDGWWLIEGGDMLAETIPEAIDLSPADQAILNEAIKQHLGTV